MVVALIALFVALSGGAYAAGLAPINSVGSRQVINNSMKGVDVNEPTLNLGRTTAIFQERPGALPLEGTFTSAGRALVIRAAGSGFSGTAGSRLGMWVSIDGVPRGEVRSYTNEASSHKPFVPNEFVVTGVPAGGHTLELDALPGTSSDGNDVFSVTVTELPMTLGLAADATEPTNNARAGNTSVCTAPAFGGVPYLFGTISPTTDVDWIHLNCSVGGTTMRLTLTGGARMDVYDGVFGSGSLVASNVTTYQAAPGFSTVRVHATAPVAYTLAQEWIPSSRPAGRSSQARLDGTVVAH
jgi:hypothetical protein